MFLNAVFWQPWMIFYHCTWSGYYQVKVYGQEGLIGTISLTVLGGGNTALKQSSGYILQCSHFYILVLVFP